MMLPVLCVTPPPVSFHATRAVGCLKGTHGRGHGTSAVGVFSFVHIVSTPVQWQSRRCREWRRLHGGATHGDLKPDLAGRTEVAARC